MATGADPTNPWTAPSVIEQSSQDVGTEGKAPYAGRNMVLTDQERQVMKDCESESFFRSALPMSFGSIFAAQMLVKSGRWKAHPKYGALPKAIVCGGVGYLFGKIIYFPICQEKVLKKIPNSNLAAVVRKAKGLPDPGDNSFVPDEFSSSDSIKQQEDYSGPDPYSPSGGSASPGLDDRFRPSVDRDVKPQEKTPEESQPKTSYEELRRRNRQQYEENQAKTPRSGNAPSYKDNPFMPQKPWPEDEKDKKTPPPPPSEQPQKRKRTNIWGDVIED